MTDMSITRSTGVDGTVRLAVAGEIDLDSSSRLAAALGDAIYAHHTRRVVVDLDRVTFLDASGIGKLVAGYTRAAAHSEAFSVANPHGMPRRVLEITGLLGILTGGPADTRARNPLV